MVCFSPDDHYLLVSAVDNEVKQLLAANGSLHLDFEIPSTGSSQNYTRSYYLNGGLHKTVEGSNSSFGGSKHIYAALIGCISSITDGIRYCLNIKEIQETW